MQVDDSDREYALKLFRGLGDRTKQWECLNSWVTLGTKTFSNSSFESDDNEGMYSKRKQYTFRLRTKDGVTKAIVCKKIFFQTLGRSYFVVFFPLFYLNCTF